MDFQRGAFGNDHQQDAQTSSHRHSSHQIARLEEMYKQCTLPDANQRKKLGAELGLDPGQIKCWFQNKRVKEKGLNKRDDNNTLRIENQKMREENSMIKERVKNMFCLACQNPEEQNICLQKLKVDNALLLQQHEKISKLLAMDDCGINSEDLSTFLPSLHIDASSSRGTPNPIAMMPSNPTVPDLQAGSSSSSLWRSSSLYQNIAPNQPALPIVNQHNILLDSERITYIANIAFDELIRLLCMDEPFWFRSIVDGKFILQREIYENTFHRYTYSRGLIESSKDSRQVSMSGTQLVHMFLSSDKWMDLFPTIINYALTIQVLESSLLGSQNGSLQVMKAKMHILSPLVPAREFFFIRYCKKIEEGVWVISDVALPPSTYDNTVNTWKFPSGCIIRETDEGSCKVSWIEHVEVDRGIQIDRLFRDVICGKNAYGAERWVSTLERMCERLTKASLESIPSCDTQQVIESIEARRGVMKLAHRMVKMFCGTLDMSGNMEFPRVTRVNNGGVRVFICKSRRPSTAPDDDVIISAATSFRLPLTPQIVFDFLRNDDNRIQWDVLCQGSPVEEIDHISSGTHCGNYTSIIWPVIPGEEKMLILQESYTHALESLLVYAPIDTKTVLEVAMTGEDSSNLPLLPSGFTISGDGQVGEAEGSLVTMVYQVLASNLSEMDNQGIDSTDIVNTLVTSMVGKIKVALNCYNR